ncbi:MAG: four helix bundle protein [Candidatus Magasanikbacteria bacterium]
MYKEFYELGIWKNGYNALMYVYTITEKYPEWEKYALVSQTVRSANSIIANIAESHGRFYYADKKRILYISRGEIAEARSHLSVAFGKNYLTKEEFIHINNLYKQLTKDLNLYINSLKK